ncbi:MAG: 1,4-alpha-glucan branching enzyme [Gemmatimonadaceae bacterium]|nr:1,4-alpha-glucan branching enzyme [Gemmatimonadaceae bacterium]
MRQTDFVLMLHSHLPYVLNHGRWPHGSDWICEAAIDTYLPLVEKLRRLEDANIAAPVTVGFTPILANQLEHPTFQQELDAYFTQRIGFCDEAPESLESTNDAHLLPLVSFWRTRLLRLRDLFHALDRDILREFRRLQDKERLEITSSAATHGFLPLLGRDESIRLQLALGRAEHVRIFGREPDGCWVPECAYRSAGPWSPFPGEPPHGVRRGIEEHLSEAGYRYFYVDSHMARAGLPLGLYGELFAGETERVALGAIGTDVRRAAHSPYRAYRVTTVDAPVPVAALVRDPRASMQVWSRHGGYPGAAPYLEFHKIRWPGGLRLWRVSAEGTDLGAKEPYVPDDARAQAHAHAAHFTSLLNRLAVTHGGREDSVIVVPFDTELFGHWWFEGPDFLGDLYATLPQHVRVRAVTASEHIDAHTARHGLRLAEGSWGKNGDYSMWMSRLVAWTWPVIWNLEHALWDAAPRALDRPDLHPILAQAARSLLLLQSSDWQFIISTGEVEDYAIKRFNGHAADTRQLLDGLRAALDGADPGATLTRAHELQERDDVFRDIIPSIRAALHREPLRIVTDPLTPLAAWADDPSDTVAPMVADDDDTVAGA